MNQDQDQEKKELNSLKKSKQGGRPKHIKGILLTYKRKLTAFTDFAVRSNLKIKGVKNITNKFKYARKLRTVSYIEKEGVKLPFRVEERLLELKLTLYPEAIPYIFNLEGCPKKLFFFLLLFREERRSTSDTNESGNSKFIFNSSVISLFHKFCELHPPVYGDNSVKQAMKHLREQNIILNLRRGENMINPMITGGKSMAERMRLMGEYSHELLNQGKDAAKYFYPK